MKRTWRVKLRVLKMSVRHLWWDIREPRTYITPEEAQALVAERFPLPTYFKSGDVLDLQFTANGGKKRYHIV